ncbi:MAG: dihydroneopterin aldolase [Cyanobacteria bacterium P01_A01_bin.135]
MAHSTPADTIQVTGIRAYGYVGLLPEEQVLGQWFSVDLTIHYCNGAGKSDRIEDAYDYRWAIEVVQHTIRNARFRLIETLAEAIAHRLLKKAQVEEVCIRLAKPAAPIPEFDGEVAVTICRRAQS